MRSLLIGLSALLLVTVSTAQEANQPKVIQLPMQIMCGNDEAIGSFLADNNEEAVASMVGVAAVGDKAEWPGVPVPTLMFVNKTKFSWTIVSEIEAGVYCITASGSYMEPMSANTPEIKKQQYEIQPGDLSVAHSR